MRCVFKPTIAALAVTGLLFVGSVPVLAQSGSRYTPPSGSGVRASEPGSGSAQRTQPAPLALEGYCAVSLKTMRKWVKGDPSVQTVFDGHTYYFANEEGKQTFVADPAKYAPVLGGDCVVALVKMYNRIAGNIRQAMYHGGRLFLMADEEAKKMFAADPQAYANADLALGGNCVVCRVDMKETMPGKPEFTVIHNGLRYLFPAAEQRDKFLANPAKYEAVAKSAQPAASGSASKEPAGSGSGSKAGSGSGHRD